MSKDTYHPLVVRLNQDIPYASLIPLHGENNVDSEKQYIVTNMEFEAIVLPIKKKHYQHMVDFVNKLEFNDQKYKINGT